MSTRLLAFTDKGLALAEDLASVLGGSSSRLAPGQSLRDWTREAFSECRAIVFVGAVGIAVRAIAPWIKSKDKDPAVVAVDETARFAVPLLSGHLGGANDLARRVAAACGAIAVVTTATDVNGVFAVDEWAKRQNCAVAEIGRIKLVSGALLSGRSAGLYSRWPIAGQMPEGIVTADADGCDFALTLWREADRALHLVPRICVLGIGRRRNTPAEDIAAAVDGALDAAGILPQAVCRVCSIDLKKDEPGLLEFCAQRGLPFETFSTETLLAQEGTFTPSGFVRSVTGVDNVCERSAVAGSGGGELIMKKTAGGGVTVAAALCRYTPDWRWRFDDNE